MSTSTAVDGGFVPDPVVEWGVQNRDRRRWPFLGLLSLSGAAYCTKGGRHLTKTRLCDFRVLSY